MGAVNFVASDFRTQFPAFQCTPPIPDSVLQSTFDTAELYINNPSGGAYCGGLTLSMRSRCLYLMTAHLTALTRQISDEQSGGVVISASVDKVSVTMLAPPSSNQWQYWLQSTPYGQQLLSLLQVASVGGLYYGGRPELSAFRRIGW